MITTTEIPHATRFPNTKTPGVFRFVSLGDVHLGHHLTPTDHIIRNLDNHCTNDRVLKDIDMLIITGDLFDRLLTNADAQVHRIQRWITRLQYRCARLGVMIRIVEGTPSHDWKQSTFFPEQQSNANIPVDLHYATTLSIEYIEKHDLHILYVPDKWRPDTSETLEEVRVLMKNKQLEQVDFAIMHGAFEYQLPAIVPEPTHDSDTYLGLVRYHILIGHVHLATQKERILAAGSYDRLNHNEEGPKGFYKVEVRSPEDYRITFMENQGAKRYVTVDCQGMDTKSANVAIRKAIAKLPKGSAIRLHCERHSPIVGDMDAIKQQYPEFEWSPPKIEKSAKEKAETMDQLMTMDINEFLPIDEDSISSLVAQHLEQHAPDDAAQRRCLSLLTELC